MEWSEDHYLIQIWGHSVVLPTYFTPSLPLNMFSKLCLNSSVEENAKPSKAL